MTPFPGYANNAVARLAQAYTPGSGQLALQPGQGAQFGATFPVTICAITQATYQPPAEVLSIYQATGIAGDTLTGVTVVEGTADRPFAAGDVVELRWTAASPTLMAQAINRLEAEQGWLAPALVPGPLIANVATPTWSSILQEPMTIPPLLLGQRLRWNLWGVYGSTATAPVLGLRILVGAVIALTGQATLGASLTGMAWCLDRGCLQVQDPSIVGLASGFYVWQGWVGVNSAANICGTQAGGGQIGAPSTIDWAIPQSVDVQVQFSIAHPNNMFQLKGGYPWIEG